MSKPLAPESLVPADRQAPTADNAKKRDKPKANKKKKPRRRRGTGSVFPYRGGYRAEITLPNGEFRFKDNFDTDAAADAWLQELLVHTKDAARPELGGPTQCTLAEMLWHYAHIYTVNKGGAEAELNRISHYLRAAELPILKLEKSPKGRRQLQQEDWRQAETLPEGFEKQRDRRLDLREGTYKAIAELATKRVSHITPLMVSSLAQLMASEGLSESTIQKEIALLKAVFNKAIEEWSWTGFVNPAVGIKLGKSEARFVVFTKKHREDLDAALARCDNPLFPLLVEAAMWTLARRASLLKLHRNDVDLESRTAVLRASKVGTVTIPLSLRAVEVLKRVPAHPSGLFFPMTASAVDNAWDSARVRAGRPDLQFRDLRHIGATTYARGGLTAHALMLALGHKTLTQALVYVNMVAKDALDLLDRAEPDPSTVPALPAAVQGSAADEMNRRRAERLNAGRQRALQVTDGENAQECASASSPSTDIPSAPAEEPATPASAQARVLPSNVLPFARKVANG